MVTRTSPQAIGSLPGSSTFAYSRLGVPTTGVIVNGSSLPSHANSVISLISVAVPHIYNPAHSTNRAESLYGSRRTDLRSPPSRLAARVAT